MMLTTIYRRLPGPAPIRIAGMVIAALIILTLVIWSYELLGDVLDSGGTVGE